MAGDMCPRWFAARAPPVPLVAGERVVHCGFQFNLPCEGLAALRTYVDAGHLSAATYESIAKENTTPGAFAFAVHYYTEVKGVDVLTMRAWYAKQVAADKPATARVKGIYLSGTKGAATVLLQMWTSTNPRTPVYALVHDSNTRSRIAARRSAYDKDDDPHMHHDFEPFTLHLVPYKEVVAGECGGETGGVKAPTRRVAATMSE